MLDRIKSGRGVPRRTDDAPSPLDGQMFRKSPADHAGYPEYET